MSILLKLSVNSGLSSITPGCSSLMEAGGGTLIRGAGFGRYGCETVWLTPGIKGSEDGTGEVAGLDGAPRSALRLCSSWCNMAFCQRISFKVDMISGSGLVCRRKSVFSCYTVCSIYLSSSSSLPHPYDVHSSLKIHFSCSDSWLTGEVDRVGPAELGDCT